MRETIAAYTPEGAPSPLNEMYWNWASGYRHLVLNFAVGAAGSEAGEGYVHVGSRNCGPEDGLALEDREACEFVNTPAVFLPLFDPTFDSVGLDVTRKLRKGHWSIQREIDLHGLRREEAREALAAFLRDSHRQGLRCIRVVHGKGLGSPGKTPVLKGKVQSWLVQKNEVLAFVQARGDEGGAGALVVLLKPLG